MSLDLGLFWYKSFILHLSPRVFPAKPLSCFRRPSASVCPLHYKPMSLMHRLRWVQWDIYKALVLSHLIAQGLFQINLFNFSKDAIAILLFISFDEFGTYDPRKTKFSTCPTGLLSIVTGSPKGLKTLHLAAFIFIPKFLQEQSSSSVVKFFKYHCNQGSVYLT